MPRCPAEADKAIRLAWERERELVSKGLGTRDWTPEQQQDILEYGKAYDDEGKAFEGQHMKSAAQYPEHQGNPDNIQFLTRKEHLEAHNGSWQNPSNWYYDPIEKQFFDFGDGAPIPCKIIELSNPIIHIDNNDVAPKADEVKQTEKAQTSGTDPPVKDSCQPSPANSPIHDTFRIPEVKYTRKRNDFRKFFSGAKKVAKVLWDNNKGKISVMLFAAVAYALDKATSSDTNSGRSTSNIEDFDINSLLSIGENDSHTIDKSDHSDSADFAICITEDEFPKEQRKSPEEHIVNARGQRYHYKDGSVRYKEKQPYKRGGDKNKL